MSLKLVNYLFTIGTLSLIDYLVKYFMIACKYESRPGLCKNDKNETSSCFSGLIQRFDKKQALKRLFVQLKMLKSSIRLNVNRNLERNDS